MAKRVTPQVAKYVAFFRLLAEFLPSAAAQKAAAIVFGGGDFVAAPPAKKQPTKPRTPEQVILGTGRIIKLATFRLENPKISEGMIYQQIHIDRHDWRRWKRGEISDRSVMSQRIELRLRPKVSENSPPTPPCFPPRRPGEDR